MSILSVDQIQPIGSGTTITLNATEIKTGTEITVGTGASIFSPAGNTLTFGTNNVERIRIKNDGNVGIGTDNPNNPLTINASGNHIFLKDTATNNVLQIRHQGGTAQFNTYGTGGARRDYVFNQYSSEVLRIDSNGRVLIGTTTEGFAEADDLTINSADHGGITIRTPTNKEGNIAFSDTTSGTGEYSGLIRYRHSNDDLGLWTNSNLRLLIDSSGNVSIANGNLVIGTSGKGIDFSAAGNVGGMTSELLDDYEEGSFSPTLINGNNGYRFQQGTYTKIGNLVTFTAYIETSATPPSGNLAFGNLPFTSIGSRSWVFPFHTNRTAFGTNSFDARAYMGGGDTNIYIYYPVNSSSSNFQPINQNGMNAANASAVWISGSYQTSS